MLNKVCIDDSIKTKTGVRVAYISTVTGEQY